MPARTLTEPEYKQITETLFKAAPSGLSEPDFQRWMGPRLAAAVGTAEHLPPVAEGTAFERFVSNLGAMVNPVAIAKGIGSAVAHPIDTATNIASESVGQGRQAVDLARQGRYVEAAGHAVGMLPVLGPAAVAAGEQIASGDVAGGFGKATGLLLPALAPTAVRGAVRAARALPESVATAAESAATKRVVDVTAPKYGVNKPRFGGMAEEVAPAVAKDLAAEGAPWSREGLHARIGTKLAEAEQALDAASDARLNSRAFPTKPLIDDLKVRRQRFVAEAVEGSKAERVASTRQSPILDAQGKPITVTELNAEPIGQDITPHDNAARVAKIDAAIGELEQLGPMARYESLRRIRQAYDGPAKAVYAPSVTQDYMAKMGEKFGAADVTGVLRERLARFDPETAKANAPYSLYRKVNDVLEATAEVERSRPRVGRQIMARLTGTLAGQHAAGVPGAITGYIFAPAVDAAVSSGVTTQLKTAALLGRLATAIRKGDLGHVMATTHDLRRLGLTSAAVVGNATSPSGSQIRTTGPIPATP